MTTPSLEFDRDHAIDSVLADVDVIAVPTDDGRDEALTRARHAALQLARRAGARVILYDRSDERWTDTPHPSGPIGADDVPDDRRHLVRQLRDFTEAGVDACAYLATVPALTAMLDVVQSSGTDVVVLPDELDAPKMMDRLQVGHTPAEMVERIAELHTDRPIHVVSVPERGPLTLVHPEETS